MSTKKSTPKKPKPKALEQKKPPAPEKGSTTTPEQEPAPTLEQLHQEILSLKQQIFNHANLITQLQETLARKRKPVTSNGKVQIRDKKTGKIYPSKNNVYQTLLKAGELKSLVDKGLFGPVPEKNTFGWYTLVREWPDRFEEVAAEEKQS